MMKKYAFVNQAARKLLVNVIILMTENSNAINVNVSLL
jgi:hypothetical protein